MAVNKAFHTNNSDTIQTEKNLYSDLVKEAIQIYGHDVYYIDRTTVAIDNVLGEDSLKYHLVHKFLLRCMLKMQRVDMKVKKN